MSVDTLAKAIEKAFNSERPKTSGPDAVIHDLAIKLATAIYSGSIPIASATTLGGIKVGVTLTIDPITGVLNTASGGGGSEVKKVPFTSTEMPIIENYQSDQVDPEDGSKTINYAESYGENPLVRCMITVDANTRYQRQQEPQFTFVDGLIDTIFFDLTGDESTGYILISKT